MLGGTDIIKQVKMKIKQRLLRIANWFQPAYKKIDEWDLPWLRELCSDLWNILDDTLKKSLFTLITGICKKYGVDKGKHIMEELKKKFDELTK